MTVSEHETALQGLLGPIFGHPLERILLWASKQWPAGVVPRSVKKGTFYLYALALTTFFLHWQGVGRRNRERVREEVGERPSLPFLFGAINNSGKKGL